MKYIYKIINMSASGKKIQYAELFAANFSWRDRELENISWFNFVKDYQVKYYGKSKQKKEGKTKFHFIDSHFGRLYTYAERKTFEVVPMI